MDTTATAFNIFNLCLHAYRAIAKAVEMGADSVIWDVRVRVELTRFEVWGRTLGFLDETTGKEKAGVISDSSLLDMADVLQVEAARNLVRDILLSLQKTFEDFKNVASKYRLIPRPKALKRDHINKLDDQLNRVWVTTKDLGLHFILVMKDKDKIRNLIQDLTELNNGLEGIFSVAQKAQSARSLASQVLNQYKEPEELKLFLGPNASDETPGNEGDLSVIPKQHEALAAVAKFKRLIVLSGTRSFPSFKNSELYKDQIRLVMAPRRTSPILPWPVSVAVYKPEGDAYPPVSVLVEWRKPDRQSDGSKTSMEELTSRRKHVVAVLHETSKVSSVAMPACRVLDCVGWFASKGQESRSSCNIVGFASRIPSWADPRRPPVSLRWLLDPSSEDGGKDIPSLRARFKLAAALSQAIYHLQCSHWLHRTLSSYQVLFFYDSETSVLRIDVPYLAGLLYSRPDDQRVDERVFNVASEGKVRGEGPLDVYMHPGLMLSPRRYRRSDDIYSLGVVLLEIALWESATEYCNNLDCNARRSSGDDDILAKTIFQAAKEELAAEVGELYQHAVIACLEGLRGPELPKDMGDGQMKEMAYDGTYKGEDPEYGLESDLLWKVVRQLEKLRV